MPIGDLTYALCAYDALTQSQGEIAPDYVREGFANVSAAVGWFAANTPATPAQVSELARNRTLTVGHNTVYVFARPVASTQTQEIAA
jgi:hypothetical protein